MDSCFENTGKLDIDAIIEMRYRLNAVRNCIWVTLFLLGATFFFVEYLLGYSYLLTSLIFLAGAVYYALLPYLIVRKQWKKSMVFHNGKLPVNTARFGERISIESTEGSRNWEYAHLTKVCSFKYSYCLCFADKTVMLLYRNNFTKGTFAEFKQFLRTKRPDLKIPE